MTTVEAFAAMDIAVAGQSPRQLFWMRFKQDKAALVGGVVIIMLIFLAIFGGPLAERVTGHPQNEPSTPTR